MKIGLLHTAFIGDLALAGLLIEGLFQQKHEIVLFTNSGGQGLYSADSRIKTIHILPKEKGIKKFIGIYKCSRIIKKENCDLLRVAHRSPTSAFITALASTKSRGFDVHLLSKFFNERISYPLYRPEALRLLELGKTVIDKNKFEKLKTINEGGPILKSKALPLHLFEKHPSLLTNGYFLISPGSRWKTKMYPQDLMAQTAIQLLETYPEKFCVVNGGPEDKEAIGDFLSHIKQICERQKKGPSFATRVIRENNVPLSEIPGLFSKAFFSLSPDSAPVHIASGMGIPAFGIYGPTSVIKGFGPAGLYSKAITLLDPQFQISLPCQPCSIHGEDQCPLGHFRCMRDLSPTTVTKTVKQFMDKIPLPMT